MPDPTDPIQELAEQGATLEPLRKVLCRCQQVDPQTGKASPCVCKSARGGPLK